MSGRVCEGCGKEFTLEIMLEREVWEAIRPKNSLRIKGGLLCGVCIVLRLEAEGRFLAAGMNMLVDVNGLYEPACSA